MNGTSLGDEAFGVGAVLGDTFALVFRHGAQLLLVGAIPAILGAALNVLAYGPAGQGAVLAVLDPEAASAAGPGGLVSLLLVMLAGLALWAFAGAALTRAAWDAHGSGRVDVRRALETGYSRLVPVMVWITLGGIVVYLGFLALIVPGLWLAGAWIALLPAIVVERLGFDAFRRSAELTRGYRWPAAGLIVLFVLAMIVLGFLVVALQAAAWSAGSLGVVLGTVISVGVSALYYALSAALAALAYARLREIKEGSGRSVADVFD